MTGAILMAAFFAVVAALSLYRAHHYGPLTLPDPESAWVQAVQRECWQCGEYSDATIYVIIRRSGWWVCTSGDGVFAAVTQGRIGGVLRAHYRQQLAAAQAELAAK